MGHSKMDLLQGTLDLMVLQTLAAMGSLHGYGIARRIEQISGDAIILNQGTIYASLVRLQQRGWIPVSFLLGHLRRGIKKMMPMQTQPRNAASAKFFKSHIYGVQRGIQ